MQTLYLQISPKLNADKNERFAVSRRMQTMNRPGIDTRLSPRHGSRIYHAPAADAEQSEGLGESQNSRQTDFGGDLSARMQQTEHERSTRWK